MRNLYLYEKAAYGLPSHAARGLQPFQQQDASTRPGCINRVLRSTLRYGAIINMRLIVGTALLITGCATTSPNYDLKARESLGRITTKTQIGTRIQVSADSQNAGPAMASVLGVAGLALGDALQKRTSIAIYEYRISTVERREVVVVSDYFASSVGDCVKVLESADFSCAVSGVAEISFRCGLRVGRAP